MLIASIPIDESAVKDFPQKVWGGWNIDVALTRLSTTLACFQSLLPADWEDCTDFGEGQLKIKVEFLNTVENAIQLNKNILKAGKAFVDGEAGSFRQLAILGVIDASNVSIWLKELTHQRNKFAHNCINAKPLLSESCKLLIDRASEHLSACLNFINSTTPDELRRRVRALNLHKSKQEREELQASPSEAFRKALYWLHIALLVSWQSLRKQGWMKSANFLFKGFQRWVFQRASLFGKACREFGETLRKFHKQRLKRRRNVASLQRDSFCLAKKLAEKHHLRVSKIVKLAVRFSASVWERYPVFDPDCFEFSLKKKDDGTAF